MTEKKELSSLITTEDQLAAVKETANTDEGTPSLQNKEKFVKSAADEDDAHFGLTEEDDSALTSVETNRPAPEADDAHFGLAEEDDSALTSIETNRPAPIIDDTHFGGETEITAGDAVMPPPLVSQEIGDPAELNRADLPEDKTGEESAVELNENNIPAAGDDVDPDSIQDDIITDLTDDVTDLFEEDDDDPGTQSETIDLEDPAEFDIGFEILNESSEFGSDTGLQAKASEHEAEAPVLDLASVSEDLSTSTDDDDVDELDGPADTAEETLFLDTADVDDTLAEVLADDDSDIVELDDDALIDILDDFKENDPNEQAESAIVNLWELAEEAATPAPLDGNGPTGIDALAELTNPDNAASEPLDDFDGDAEGEFDSQFFVDEDDLEMDILDDSDDLGTDLFDEEDLFDPIDLDDGEQDVVELTGEESVIALDDETIFDLSALADDADPSFVETDATAELADIDEHGLFAVADLEEEPAADEDAPVNLIDDLDDALNPVDDDDFFDFTDLDDPEIQDLNDPDDAIAGLTDDETSLFDDEERLFEEDDSAIDLAEDILDEEDAVIDLTAESPNDDSDIIELADSTDEENGIIDLIDENVEDPVELTESPGIDTEAAEGSTPATFLTGDDQNAEISGAISRQQLDQTLERVVEKMLADKIDTILTEVIERAVTREINRIKGILLDNSSEGE